MTGSAGRIGRAAVAAIAARGHTVVGLDILASSGQAIVGHRKAGNIPVRAGAPYAPRYLYACTKVFLEQLGQVYVAHHGMKVIAARLGWCPRNQGQIAELTASPDDQDVYLSADDAGRFFASAVDASLGRLPPFAPVYVTSRPLAQERYDLAPARDLFGYVPHDSWPTDAGAF